MLTHKFGFPLLCELAIVLESEVKYFQSRLFVWAIVMLQLTLMHFGTSASESAFPPATVALYFFL